MRILYFSRDYTPHDHRFLTALAQTKHQIYYLRLENKERALEKRPLPAKVRLIPWAGGQKPFQWRDGLSLLIGLKRVIRKVAPDIIHAGPVQRSAFLVALSGFRPLVTISWGYDLLMDTKRNFLWAFATRFTLKRSTAFVDDCKTIRNLAINYGMDENRIVTFPWGIDIDHYTPSHEQSPVRTQLGWDDKFILISTRSWDFIYGVTDLAKAFVQAARQYSDLRLLLLGSGPQGDEIKNIFTKADMSDRIYFPGQVAQKRLPDYYRAADLYISTSHSDGTSISLLEALACGTPVILSDIPGNKEWAKNCYENRKCCDIGWLFSDGDVDDLVETLLHAVDSQKKLPKKGEAARLLVEEHANWNHNFPKLLKAYQMALEEVKP